MDQEPGTGQLSRAETPSTQETAVASKKQILKATGALGSAQLMITLIGVIKVKILAVLLGAVGVGVAGLYQNTMDIIRAATGLGLKSSAVRDIASSAATGDQIKISETIKVLRSWAWFTGIVGMLVTILFCKSISRITFGSTDYAWGVATLSVSVLLVSITEGQSVLLQGLRKIGDMSKARVGSSLLGLIGAVIIYWVWGMRGIVPALLFSALAGLICNWHYSSKIVTVQVSLALKAIFRQGKSMATLGFYLSIKWITGLGVMYLVRAFVAKGAGLASVGYFVAAYSISYIYLSSIFGAMGSDYYPRLSAVQEDHSKLRELVNEQIEVSLLITAPIIIGMVTFIDVVVNIFYSREFGPTINILDWQLLGDFFKTLAWPLGFILLAKGKGKHYLFIEISWNAFYLLGVYLLWDRFGIVATGIAFLVSFILNMLVVYVLAWRIIGFRFSQTIVREILIFFPLLLAAFLALKIVGKPWSYLIGGCACIFATLYSYNKLKMLLPIEKIFRKLRVRS